MIISTLVKLRVWFAALDNGDIIVTIKILHIMEAICKSSNHWENEAPAVQDQDNIGEWEVLTDSGMNFVIYVIQKRATQSAGIITSADVCRNKFAT